MSSRIESYLIVEGNPLPTPSEMILSDYDISESNRNANGIMVSQIIRADVHKLECKWRVLRPDMYQVIRNAIRNKFGLSVQYYVADLNGRGNLIMYAGDRKTPTYTFERGMPVYHNFAVNFIEM